MMYGSSVTVGLAMVLYSFGAHSKFINSQKGYLSRQNFFMPVAKKTNIPLV